MWGSLAVAGASVLGGVLGMKGAQDANEANARNVALTNETNLRIARERNYADMVNTDNTNRANRESVMETNALNRWLYKDNRDWEENMANTAYQRQVADMEKAGINPMLAIMKGGGAPVPSSSAPTMQAPIAQKAGVEMARATAPVVSNELEYLGNGVSSAVSSGLSLMDTETRRRAQESQAALQRDQAAVARSELPLKAAQTAQVTASIEKMMADLENAKADTRVKIASLDKMFEEIGLIRANRDLSLASARESAERTKWAPTYARESAERTKYIGNGWDVQLGKILKDTITEAKLKLGVGENGGGLSLFEKWLGLTGGAGRSVGIGDVFGIGGGNGYGGQSSAKEHHFFKGRKDPNALGGYSLGRW